MRVLLATTCTPDDRKTLAAARDRGRRRPVADRLSIETPRTYAVADAAELAAVGESAGCPRPERSTTPVSSSIEASRGSR